MKSTITVYFLKREGTLMNILLVSGHLGLGGVQKMVTILGEELSQRNNVYYYSIDKSELFWNIKKKEPYFIRSCKK